MHNEFDDKGVIGERVMDKFGYNSSLWFSALILFILIVAFRALAYMAFVLRIKKVQ